eukprot:9076316-Alexandrium_andersonii.AAC.1
MFQPAWASAPSRLSTRAVRTSTLTFSSSRLPSLSPDGHCSPARAKARAVSQVARARPHLAAVSAARARAELDARGSAG